MSVSAQASLLEIGQTISTWPQLASSVVLGGGTVTDVARRILLDKLQQSGRFYVDVESIVCDLAETEVIDCREDIAFPPSLSTSTAETKIRMPRRSSNLVVSQDEFRWLISQAVLAPSGGNSQPWRFECGDNQIIGYRDPSRRSPLLDFDFQASDVALGAAAENIDLAARVLGLKASWDYFPRGNEDHCVFVSRLERCEGIDADPLHAQIAQRCTNRKQAQWKALLSSNAIELEQEASLAGATLHVISDQEALTNIGELIGRVDRLRFFSQPMHTELIQELRWTEQEVVQTRDGIDIATLELNPGERAVMELFRSWPAMERLKQIQGGGGFVQAARQSVEKSSAICLLSMPGKGRQRFVLGGRALQRVWLRATALGLAIQPMSVLVYLLSRLEDGLGCGLGAEEQDDLREIGFKFHRIVGMQSDHADILLFRLFHADPPAIRAIRRNVSSISNFSNWQS